jgi:hypothetical protein
VPSSSSLSFDGAFTVVSGDTAFFSFAGVMVLNTAPATLQINCRPNPATNTGTFTPTAIDWWVSPISVS